MAGRLKHDRRRAKKIRVVTECPVKVSGLQVKFSAIAKVFLSTRFFYPETIVEPGKVIITVFGKSISLSEEKALELGVWLKEQHGWRSSSLHENLPKPVCDHSPRKRVKRG